VSCAKNVSYLRLTRLTTTAVELDLVKGKAIPVQALRVQGGLGSQFL